MDLEFVLVNQIKQTFRRGFLTTLPSLGPHLSIQSTNVCNCATSLPVDMKLSHQWKQSDSV